MVTKKRRGAKKSPKGTKSKRTEKIKVTVARDNGRKAPLKVSKTGRDLLNDPYLNKGMAFTEEERRELGLEGLLPPAVRTIEHQSGVAYENVKRTGASDPDLLYSALRHLKNRNETLFSYRSFTHPRSAWRARPGATGWPDRQAYS
jgi:hypothetical protein